jgi:hypothetical protein
MEKYTIQVQLLSEPDENTPWTPILEIPLVDPPKYSLKPMKWLRYIVAAILGTEGDLFNPANDQQVDYDDYEPDVRVLRYRHRSLFKVIDFLALDHVTSSRWTDEARADFRTKLIARDRRCIPTGDQGDFCKAAHIIPFSKGSSVCDVSFALGESTNIYRTVYQIPLRMALSRGRNDSGVDNRPKKWDSFESRCGCCVDSGLLGSLESEHISWHSLFDDDHAFYC